MSTRPDKMQARVVPLSVDRPPSPSDPSSDSPVSDLTTNFSLEKGNAIGQATPSPNLPANPPPTPETPSMSQNRERSLVSASDLLGPFSPLSPPPSPPPDPGSLRNCNSFRFSEALMVSKRQAASIHGEWMKFQHVAIFDRR